MRSKEIVLATALVLSGGGCAANAETSPTPAPSIYEVCHEFTVAAK